MAKKTNKKPQGTDEILSRVWINTANTNLPFGLRVRLFREAAKQAGFSTQQVKSYLGPDFEFYG